MGKFDKSVLIIGPFPKPITGNSIANKVVFEGLNKKKGVKVRRINSSTSFFDEKVGVFSFKKAFNSLRFNFEGYKIFRSDIVYITPGQSFLGVLKYAFLIWFSKALRKKVVLHIHGNYLRDEYRSISRIKKRVARSILGIANKGIVLSESLTPNLTPFLKSENIEIVYNFVEDYLLEGLNKEVVKNKNLKKLRVIYLSNLMIEKGIIDLLEALKILEKDGVEFEAKLAGNIDINSRDRINEYLETLNNVSYIGVVDGDDKKRLLLWGNVFVFPSYYKMEGQPLSIIEAMATGNVILTTNHAGISDIFSSKNGLFVEPQNPTDIILKMKNVMKEKNKFEEIMRYNHQQSSTIYRSDLFINKIYKILKEV
ncbi:glycosyltransferase family 4 protein [Seonamhaeicola sp. MEBiC1930]|uniref:glycosyltransferase family 4 protein n=1 Tax=Seonamhaeicola sp. MEBiC01930 TaxID=2976768 RepID=UPI00324AD905